MERPQRIVMEEVSRMKKNLRNISLLRRRMPEIAED
jgi:hypothetical protein